MPATTCIISRAGVTSDGRTMLQLKAVDNSFDWQMYLASPGVAREMLAIALAAITTEKQVYCAFADTSVAWSEVLQMQIIK